MTINATTIEEKIDGELAHVLDRRVVEHINRLLVKPKPILRNWDYGTPGQQFACWEVLNDIESSTGIAYCDDGFGPRNPWGLVWLDSRPDKPQSMGMDSGWFSTFMDAYFDSFASCTLPIYRVFKTNQLGNTEPITEESSWEETWSQVNTLRVSDPESRYDCSHTIVYRPGS